MGEPAAEDNGAGRVCQAARRRGDPNTTADTPATRTELEPRLLDQPRITMPTVTPGGQADGVMR
ncbi:hypothetical protein [Streptomyces sp. NPDC046870]|uniref:hypothetical protein n=1 Tax=Streptomyces sp. NPDC046870 TaxID=3155135 RepID=UPI003454CDE3